MKVKNLDGEILDITEKAYLVVYKSLGFVAIGDEPKVLTKEVKSEVVENKETIETIETVETVEQPKGLKIPDFDDVTIREIKTILKDRGVEFNDRATKTVLYDLLKA